MKKLITCFYLASIQLFDKSLQKIILVSIFGSACLFVILWLFIGYTFSYTDFFSTSWFFGAFDWALTKITGVFGSTIIFAITWFLFPSVLSIIITFFLENVIQAIEEKHYPNLSPTRKQRPMEIFRITLKFTVLSISFNILVIPVYMIFFFLGPINLIIFYILNGYLLGREYFELVAYRRFTPIIGKYVYQKIYRKIFWTGITSAFLMTIPIVNMITPIISAAAMVHVLQRFSEKSNLNITELKL